MSHTSWWTRLFRARISFDSTAAVPGGGEVDRWVDIEVAPKR